MRVLYTCCTAIQYRAKHAETIKKAGSSAVQGLSRSIALYVPSDAFTEHKTAESGQGKPTLTSILACLLGFHAITLKYFWENCQFKNQASEALNLLVLLFGGLLARSRKHGNRHTPTHTHTPTHMYKPSTETLTYARQELNIYPVIHNLKRNSIRFVSFTWHAQIESYGQLKFGHICLGALIFYTCDESQDLILDPLTIPLKV